MPPLSETISRKAPRVTTRAKRQPQKQPPLTTPKEEAREQPAETESTASPIPQQGPIPQPEQEWLGLMMERLNAEE